MEPLCFHQAIGEGRHAVDSKGTVTWGPLFSRLDVVVPCSPRPPMGWGNNRKRGSSTGSLADSPRLKLGGGNPVSSRCLLLENRRNRSAEKFPCNTVLLFLVVVSLLCLSHVHWGRPWRCRLRVTTQSVPFSLDVITQCNRKDRTSEQDTPIGGDLYA